MLAAEETLETLQNLLSSLSDPRDARGRRHPLVSVMTIAILGAICGCDDAEALSDWAAVRQDALKRYLELPHGTPSQDTFLRVLARISPHQFNDVLMRWARVILPDVVDAHIAIDGKTVRGSHDRSVGLHPIHMVSAYVVGAGLTLAQLKVNPQTNETKTMHDLLNLLELKDTTTTIDAAGCYEEIASTITSAGGDYVLAVKENQPTLLADVKSALSERGNGGITSSQMRFIEKGHGRLETRLVTVSTSTERISDTEKWSGIRCFFKLETERTIISEDRTTRGVRYFISSKELSPEQAMRYVRGHWAIENEVHWWLDVVSNDDSYRGRYGYTPQNMSKLKRFALNVMKTAPPFRAKKNVSLRRKRRICDMDENYFLQTLKAALKSRE